MQNRTPERDASAGFSLVELMIALSITLVLMSIAAQMMAASLNVRARENARIEAIADVQRALQMMSREISNAGVGLTTNGIVAADSSADQLRVRSNLNAFGEDPPDTADSDEDVVYAIINNFTGGDPAGQRLITRQDVNSGTISPLANRVDGLQFDYLNANGAAAASPGQAVRVRITVWVILPAAGTAGRPGYQPASRMQLVSDITLRNQMLTE